MVGLAFQPYHLWPLAYVGLIAFPLTLLSIRWRTALLRGYCFGVGLFVVSVPWMAVLGWWVAAALIAVVSLWYGIVAVVIALAHRTPWWPLAATGAWLAMEWVSSRFPIGGFGWVRLGYTAVGTPLDGLFPLVTISGVSAAIVALCFTIASLIDRMFLGTMVRRTAAEPGEAPSLALNIDTTGRWRHFVPTVAVIVVCVILSAAGFHDNPAPTGQTVNIGIVQGNVPGSGIDAIGRARTITNNHLAETIALAAKIATGEATQPDFLVWPENATDLDPTRDAATKQAVDVSLAIAGVPILVGAVTLGPGDNERQTTGLWYETDGTITATYHKRNLVPFGEWIPLRSFFLPLFPILQKAGAQSVPGTTPGVFSVAVGGQPLRVGDLVCFELAYDATFDEMLHGDATTGGGAQVVVVQTNNSTYTYTGQMAQQDAITQARAMEARREIAVATTNSLAGLILPDGTHAWQATERVAMSTVVTLPLRTELTPAVRFRGWIDAALIVVPLLVWAVALVIGVASGVPRRTGVRAVRQ